MDAKLGVLLIVGSVTLVFLCVLAHVLLRRLNEVECVVWALHRQQHNCDTWKCVEYAKELAKSKDA